MQEEKKPQQSLTVFFPNLDVIFYQKQFTGGSSPNQWFPRWCDEKEERFEFVGAHLLVSRSQRRI